MGTGTGLMFVGVVWLAIAWLLHSRAPGGGDIGEWRDAPDRIRRFARRGSGPIFYWSLVAEAWGLAMVIAGVLIATNLVPTDSERTVAATVLFGGAYVLGAGLLLLELLGWGMRRQSN
jgi:hypothetical protein